MRDLDDTRLAKLANDDPCAWEECRDMAREILRRRAADLSEADKEALRLVRRCVWWDDGNPPTAKSMEEVYAGMRVLDRLIGASGG